MHTQGVRWAHSLVVCSDETEKNISKKKAIALFVLGAKSAV